LAKVRHAHVVAEQRVVLVAGDVHALEPAQQVGLDVPEITTLCAMLRERGIPVEEGIYTVEDALAAVSRLLLEKGGHNS
jgi:hypothetical protein